MNLALLQFDTAFKMEDENAPCKSVSKKIRMYTNSIWVIYDWLLKSFLIWEVYERQYRFNAFFPSQILTFSHDLKWMQVYSSPCSLDFIHFDFKRYQIESLIKNSYQTTMGWGLLLNITILKRMTRPWHLSSRFGFVDPESRVRLAKLQIINYYIAKLDDVEI